MYDCSGPMLVFVTQCHHPLLGHHTGYIFAEYDVTYPKPRELFFAHIAEAQAYALKRGDALNLMEQVKHIKGNSGAWARGLELTRGPGMQLVMNPDAKPERLSAMSYLLSLESDARFGDMTDVHTNERRRRRRKLSKAMLFVPVAPPEVDDVGEGEAVKIDFFGEDL